jgi:hypothetical protein
LGIGDAILESLLLIWVVVGVVHFFTGDGGAERWASVLIPGLALIFEKVETIFHARHYVNEYIPAEQNFAPAATS